eukprot:4231326-Amphidinium_carterae.2
MRTRAGINVTLLGLFGIWGLHNVAVFLRGASLAGDARLFLEVLARIRGSRFLHPRIQRWRCCAENRSCGCALPSKSGVAKRALYKITAALAKSKSTHSGFEWPVGCVFPRKV